jgi:RNA recognition motif-containing protein
MLPSSLLSTRSRVGFLSSVPAAFRWHHLSRRQQQKNVAVSSVVLLFAYNNNKKKNNSNNADSKIGSIHKQRLQAAGRIGTKRYIDPCKVFFGNLPFSVDESQLEDYVCQSMGYPASSLLHKVRIVRDWKTHQSKGYGFVDFIEPVFATVAMDKCHGSILQNRTLTVTQGRKKPNENILYVQNKNNNNTSSSTIDPESQSIQAEIRQAEIPSVANTRTTRMDPQEKKFWKLLDPDLVDDDEEDFELDDEIMEDETENTTLVGITGNRKSRREQARKIKRIKRPSKGFGS